MKKEYILYAVALVVHIAGYMVIRMNMSSIPMGSPDESMGRGLTILAYVAMWVVFAFIATMVIAATLNKKWILPTLFANVVGILLVGMFIK